MNLMDQLAKILVSAKVGKVIYFQGLWIKPIPSANACDDCVFDTPEKAEGCRFRNACMAHLRKDKESVVFANDALNYKK